MPETDPLQPWDDWSRRPYIVEIARQCALALRATDELTEALNTQGTVSLAVQYAEQAFLGAAANVSKMFSPSSQKPWARMRGQKLLELFNVAANSPVLDRDVRNHFEHIDDRIDSWILAQPRLTAEQVEAGEMDALATAPPARLRIVDPKAGTISFGEAEVSVPDLYTELARILSVARDLEPAANTQPGLAELIATLPYYPEELRLSAPSRRPDEPVTAGLDTANLPSFEEALRHALEEAAKLEDDAETPRNAT